MTDWWDDYTRFRSALNESFPHLDVLVWGGLFLVAVYGGIKDVERHVNRRRTSMDGIAKDKASLFRSAKSVEEAPGRFSLFYGRPAIFRILPKPVIVFYLALWWFVWWFALAFTVTVVGWIWWTLRQRKLDRLAWERAHYTVTEQDHTLLSLGWKSEDVILRPREEWAPDRTTKVQVVNDTHVVGGRKLVFVRLPLPVSFTVHQEERVAADLNARFAVTFAWTFDHQNRWVAGCPPVVPDYPTDVRWTAERVVADPRGYFIGLDLDTQAALSWSTKAAPHGQIVGETNSGKTVFLTMLAVSHLLKDPDNEVLLCSTKAGGSWTAILAQHPRVLEVATTPGRIALALSRIYEDAQRREETIRAGACDDDNEYFQRYGIRVGPKTLVIVDELEDLQAPTGLDSDAMKEARKTAHGLCETIARRFRWVGIHLLIGTQIPKGGRDGVVTPTLWGNTMFKVSCGPVPKRAAEQTMGVYQVPEVPGAEVDELGNPIEETRVPGRGLCRLSSSGGVKRVQLAWLGPMDEWLQNGYEIGPGGRFELG